MANTPRISYASCRLTVDSTDISEKGILIAITSAGKAVKAADASGYTVVGVNEETADAGDYIVAISGIYRLDNSTSHAVAQANIGDSVYVEDETTVSTDGGTNSIVAGTVVDVDSNGVWVKVGV